MNVNQKIESSLAPLVDGNIWPLSCPLEEQPDTFIVYVPESEKPRDWGDDEDLRWIHTMEVNWFGRNAGSRAPVDYVTIRKEIRAALRSAGFTVSEILTNYEKDTGYTHLTIVCEIEEDEPYGEV